MIEIVDKQILIDGAPRLIMSGEIHYFRLDRAGWQDRIDRLKEAGGNAVASYIPWLWHERADGAIDLTGESRPERDLAGFIDLCAANDLWFFARPGPFVMAELKNEGLPHRLYDRYPEIVPVSWDGKPAPTRTVDYLAPAFLAETERWYAAVAEVLVPRLQPGGGNVIGVQLDNEIGMLSWISNSPDLTDLVLADLWEWLGTHHGEAERGRRYPPDRFGPAMRAESFRAPTEEGAAAFMRDLGLYQRDRFARYVAALRGFAEAAGITGVPFIVNVHGTADGRGRTFPIGISQLYESYTRVPGYLSGSDIYLGDLTVGTAADLYLINAFMDAVHRPEQPLTSVEFECGDGDYGDDLQHRTDPAAADHKLRLCVAQGNRLVNFYLFTGGVNPRLDEPVGDGNDRIGFTGERHGYAAPIGPEGQTTSTYPRLARTIGAIMAVEPALADAREERDDVVFGFIPDYYLTESAYPGSGTMTQIESDLARTRFGGPNQSLARAMLLAGFRFGALDLQSAPLDPVSVPVLALASARMMDPALQTRIADYVEGGGKLLLVGELPLTDMEGASCTHLIERFGLGPLGQRRASAHYHLSVVPVGWAVPRAETRVSWAQVFAPTGPDVLFRLYDTGEACGFDLSAGRGRAIVLTSDLPTDLAFVRQAFARLGVEPGLAHGCPDHGIVLTSTRSAGGERFVHLLNLDGFAKAVRLTDEGRNLLPGQTVTLRPKEGVMLPFGVAVGPARVVRSTAEMAAVAPDHLTVRLTQPRDWIELDTARPPLASDDYALQPTDDGWLITPNRPSTGNDATDLLTIRFG
ncbi:MAG: beta-galactosidase [Chloroflexota bacterium]|nr:beta-galactosidase [Chloroflexota bacterium]